MCPRPGKLLRERALHCALQPLQWSQYNIHSDVEQLILRGRNPKPCLVGYTGEWVKEYVVAEAYFHPICSLTNTQTPTRITHGVLDTHYYIIVAKGCKINRKWT